MTRKGEIVGHRPGFQTTNSRVKKLGDHCVTKNEVAEAHSKQALVSKFERDLALKEVEDGKLRDFEEYLARLDRLFSVFD